MEASAAVASEASSRNAAPLVTIVGRPGSAIAWAIRDFLYRSDVPFRWVEVRDDAEARDKAQVPRADDARLPVCIFADGTRMECPTIRQITQKLGWFRDPARTEYDLAIYGAGPAGLSAAVYGAADGLKTVVVERWAVGGQAGSSSRIENYLGFPKGISGNELFERARDQALRFGAEILIAREGVRAEFPPGKGVGYLEDGTKIIARASICATGVVYRRLGLANENKFLGAGVYYGAGASEAGLARGEHVFVVGGGNSAGQSAMHFSATASRVTMVVRDQSLDASMSAYLIDRIRSAPNVEVLTGCEVTALHGDALLEEITLRDRASGEERTFRIHWLFVCIGGVPQTAWAVEAGILRDDKGYLLTGPDLSEAGRRPARWPLDRDPYYLETSVPGVFAAGDVRHGSVKRCASAVGEGSMAVAFVQRHLASN
jgi:thioredoxin reductase (NADPH)